MREVRYDPEDANTPFRQIISVVASTFQDCSIFLKYENFDEEISVVIVGCRMQVVVPLRPRRGPDRSTQLAEVEVKSIRAHLAAGPA